MPYLQIQTDVALDASGAARLAKEASRLISRALGKDERYVMIALNPVQCLTFAGKAEPAAFLTLKSIRLNDDQVRRLSAALSEFVQRDLGIPPQRTYIEFSDVEPKLWGWNGTTF